MNDISYIMPHLCPETGYDIASVSELFFILKAFMLLDKLEQVSEPIEPQRITGLLAENITIETGELLDALKIYRIPDRMHLTCQIRDHM